MAGEAPSQAPRIKPNVEPEAWLTNTPKADPAGPGATKATIRFASGWRARMGPVVAVALLISWLTAPRIKVKADESPRARRRPRSPSASRGPDQQGGAVGRLLALVGRGISFPDSSRSKEPFGRSRWHTGRIRRAGSSPHHRESSV